MLPFNEKKQNQSYKHNKVSHPDGLDVEFSEDKADHDDLEALARSKEADKRAKSRKNI